MEMERSDYHIPVLLEASTSALHIRPDGVYVDVTFGGGGHSRAILSQLTTGKLFAFDQDADAQANAPDDERFTLIPQNFRFTQNFLRMHGVRKVDGILADLGISSHQIDEGSRGFSTRFDAVLDMRMDQSGGMTAAEFIQQAEEEELLRVFKQYGELPGTYKLVRKIIAARSERPIERTSDLVALAQPLAPPAKGTKFLAQVFQAIRIAVNDELGALEALLTQSIELLKPGGRLCVISYHSLEDRMVKHFMRAGNFSGEVEKDFFGNPLSPFKVITRSAIQADENELESNKRSRSARLRVAERL